MRRFFITKFEGLKELLTQFLQQEENKQNRFALELQADFCLGEGDKERARGLYL